MTPDPTSEITENPTNEPTTEPTNEPSLEPTSASPTTYPTSPTASPTTSKRLEFFCRYREDHDAALSFVSYTTYGKLMRDVIMDSIQSVIQAPLDYDEVTANENVPWRRAGIPNFIICHIFEVSLQGDCPEYNRAGSLGEDEYIAIGFFGIIADTQLDAYQNTMIDILTGDNFKDTLTENMNAQLSNVSLRRRILEYTNFEAITVDVIDPLNTTFYDLTTTTTEEPTVTGEIGQGITESSNTNITIIVTVIVLCSLVIIVGSYLMYRKYRNKKEKDAVHTDNAVAIANEYIKREKAVEMGRHVKMDNNQQMSNGGIDKQGYALPLTMNGDRDDRKKKVMDIPELPDSDHEHESKEDLYRYEDEYEEEDQDEDEYEDEETEDSLKRDMNKIKMMMNLI